MADERVPNASITAVTAIDPDTSVTHPTDAIKQASLPAAVRSENPVDASQAQVIRLNLAQERDQQTVTHGIYLQNGDTVVVAEQNSKPIYVIGMVNKPGEIKVPPDRSLRVLEAVALAGGVDRNSLPSKAVIIRQEPDESALVTIRIDLNQAKRNMAENIRLTPGDTVSVEETAMSYVRGLLRGAVRLGVGADFVPAVY